MTGDNGAVTSSPSPTEVTILGSTGSIGTQALEVLARFPGRFTVAAAAGATEDLAAAIRAKGGADYAPEIVIGPTAATEVACLLYTS